MTTSFTIGVLALQGAFQEHIQLLRAATTTTSGLDDVSWSILEVRTQDELSACDALVIPGGESTTMALVAQRSGLLEPLREFVKYETYRILSMELMLNFFPESSEDRHGAHVLD